MLPVVFCSFLRKLTLCSKKQFRDKFKFWGINTKNTKSDVKDQALAEIGDSGVGKSSNVVYYYKGTPIPMHKLLRHQAKLLCDTQVARKCFGQRDGGNRQDTDGRSRQAQAGLRPYGRLGSGEISVRPVEMPAANQSLKEKARQIRSAHIPSLRANVIPHTVARQDAPAPRPHLLGGPWDRGRTQGVSGPLRRTYG